MTEERERERKEIQDQETDVWTYLKRDNTLDYFSFKSGESERKERNKSVSTTVVSNSLFHPTV